LAAGSVVWYDERARPIADDDRAISPLSRDIGAISKKMVFFVKIHNGVFWWCQTSRTAHRCFCSFAFFGSLLK
jgi:hypothetical protein